jgi:PTS system nitrogen regulatory IIA component
MKIADLLAPGAVIDLAGTSPAEVLAELAAPVARAHGLDAGALAAALAERERLGSTGVGEGVAIPHARVRGLPALAAAFGRKRGGLEFKALDGKPATLFLALFAPESSAGTHLHALAKASRIFRSATFRERALAAADAAALRAVLVEEDGKP